MTRMSAPALRGAVIAPVALASGLQRTSGSSASLLLTLEALFTAVLAWRLYGETMDKRMGAAMLFLLAGGIALVSEQGLAGDAQLLGLLAVLMATAAWGVGRGQHAIPWRLGPRPRPGSSCEILFGGRGDRLPCAAD